MASVRFQVSDQLRSSKLTGGGGSNGSWASLPRSTAHALNGTAKRLAKRRCDRRSNGWSNPRRVLQVKLRAEVALGCPDILVSEGELDLLEGRLAAACQLGEGATQVVGASDPSRVGSCK